MSFAEAFISAKNVRKGVWDVTVSIQILATILRAITKPIAATAQMVRIHAYSDPGTTPFEKKFTQ